MPADQQSQVMAASPIELSFPESGSTCDCAQDSEPLRPCKQPKLWHSVSETLSDWKTQQTSQLRRAENHDDIAVRAVSEGWNAVYTNQMSASWRILREVDQKVWASCRSVDRLAVLSVMNLLLEV